MLVRGQKIPFNAPVVFVEEYDNEAYSITSQVISASKIFFTSL
jgi:hypothetical protein